MGDPIPNRRSNRLPHLPRHRSNRFRRTGYIHVCAPILGIVVANSFQCSPIFSQIVIYLQTLSDGEPHPEADCSPIKYVRMDTTRFFFISVSLSGSRLAMLGGRGPRKNIVIWDWRSGDLLFVRPSFLLLYRGRISSIHLGVDGGAVQFTGIHR